MANDGALFIVVMALVFAVTFMTTVFAITLVFIVVAVMFFVAFVMVAFMRYVSMSLIKFIVIMIAYPNMIVVKIMMMYIPTHIRIHPRITGIMINCIPNCIRTIS